MTLGSAILSQSIGPRLHFCFGWKRAVCTAAVFPRLCCRNGLPGHSSLRDRDRSVQDPRNQIASVISTILFLWSCIYEFFGRVIYIGFLLTESKVTHWDNKLFIHNNIKISIDKLIIIRIMSPSLFLLCYQTNFYYTGKLFYFIIYVANKHYRNRHPILKILLT